MNLTGTKVSKSAIETFKKKRLSDGTINPMFRNPTITM
jgi:hypothetical protein